MSLCSSLVVLKYPHSFLNDTIQAKIKCLFKENVLDSHTKVSSSELEWLAGGSEIGKIIRSTDWSKTALGPITKWPASLRTTVSLCLGSNFPINIIWGPEHIQIYNDGYKVLCGAAHPRALGEAYNITWASAWPAIGKPFEQALEGKTSYIENQRMFLERNGYQEETFFTFSLSPIRDDSGNVVGVFHPVTETTSFMLAERRLQTIRDLATSTIKARNPKEAGALVSSSLKKNSYDLPFMFLYLLDEDKTQLNLVGHTGNIDSSEIYQTHIDLNSKFANVLNTKDIERFDTIEEDFGSIVCGDYPEPVKSVYVMPLMGAGTDQPLGLIILGIGPRLPFNNAYTTFFELLRNTITTTINNARAFQDELKRAQALVALDKAKTTFFSNVSHEFRTPLTLILGSLEESLANEIIPLEGEQRANQDLIYRNALRLLKLVNTLLDFSRIEAGRVEGKFEPTDLAVLSRDLASTFRSAVERAGIKLHVDIPSLDELIYIDHDMWEKIVLNLLSNAFKYTFKGEIRVILSLRDNDVVLSVIDSGIGIPKSELSHIFDRFHRIDKSRGRTHEGTGIGLSLVQELVKLHRGKIKVESTLGKGSTFEIFIPRGKSHLVESMSDYSLALPSTAIAPEAFVQEALAWVPADGEKSDEISVSDSGSTNFDYTVSPKSIVLVADDNADMRSYLKRILAKDFIVETVADGESALEFINKKLPDLVLTDVMMPKLDGYQLLDHLRKDPKTKTLPILLLSARAGEEARIEGLNRGANDYIIKPFNAKELIAKLKSTMEISKIRREADNQMRDFFMQSPIPMVIFEGPEHFFTLANPPYEKFVGRKVTGKKLLEVFAYEEVAIFIPLLDQVYITGIPYIGKDIPFVTTDESGKSESHLIDIGYHPLKGAHGEIKGLMAIVQEVTDVFKSKQLLKESKMELQEIVFEQSLLLIELEDERDLRERFVATLSHDLRTPLTAAKMTAQLMARKTNNQEFMFKGSERIVDSINRADMMIRDLLDANRLKAGEKLPIAIEACNLKMIADDTIFELAEVHGDRFVLKAPSSIEGQWGPNEIKRILENLLTNAIKYGSLETPITMTISKSLDAAFIEVHNQGNPISPADQKILFDQYKRLTSAHSGKQTGWGLGLTLVKGLVEAHHGTVGLESSPEKGTTFKVALPLNLREL